jgi:hypothetical protein
MPWWKGTHLTWSIIPLRGRKEYSYVCDFDGVWGACRVEKFATPENHADNIHAIVRSSWKMSCIRPRLLQYSIQFIIHTFMLRFNPMCSWKALLNGQSINALLTLALIWGDWTSFCSSRYITAEKIWSFIKKTCRISDERLNCVERGQINYFIKNSTCILSWRVRTVSKLKSTVSIMYTRHVA